jgi:hypothetical protein
MPARRLPLAALPALVGALALSACDSAGTSPVSGVWEGTAHFEADTLLPAHNARVTADFDMTFRFELVEDDGLVSGQITGTATGTRIVREAGGTADTTHFDGSAPLVHNAYGTYLEPTLEVDVPDGPYEEDLWTFEVSGGRAQLERFLVSTNNITLPSGAEFTVNINSDGDFAMRRVSNDEPAAVRPGAAPPAGLSLPTPAR